MAESKKDCLLVALGTRDGKTLTRGHFGDSSIFLIYELCEGAEPRFIEDRSNMPYEEKGHGDPGKARLMAGIMRDVDVLAGRIFGPNIQRMLQRFVAVRVRVDVVDEALPLLVEALPLLRQAQETGPGRDLIVLPRGAEKGSAS